MVESDTARGLLDDTRSLLAGEEWIKLVTFVGSLHPADIAELALLLDGDERRAFIEHLPRPILGQVFEFAESTDLEELVRTTDVSALAEALAEVDVDVVADVLQELEPDERADTLAALGRPEGLEDLLEYEEESAGGIMSRGFVALQESLTVQQAIDYLRAAKPSSSETYYLYVVDAAQRLVGTLGIRDLLVSPPQTPLLDIANRNIRWVTTETDQEEAARTLQRYNLLALPVVNDSQELVGVTLAADLIDVLAEEATEDMYRMVGVDVEERVFAPVRTSVQRRLPWLLVNTVTAFIGAAVVSLFDETLAKVTLLAFFMPIVAGQGGNAGTQTATIAVRSIALGDLRVTDIVRASRKEIMVGMANGVAVGLAAGLASFAWQQNVALSLVLSAALVLTITVATLNGILIPLGLKAINVDPALATNIFVTMSTDILGFFFFLGLATLAINQIA